MNTEPPPELSPFRPNPDSFTARLKEADEASKRNGISAAKDIAAACHLLGEAELAARTGYRGTARAMLQLAEARIEDAKRFLPAP